MLTCRSCGGTPAADVTFRGCAGLAIASDWTRHVGPFCRECGLATFREVTAHTLKKAWWGLFTFFAAPYLIVANVRQARQLPTHNASGSTGTPLPPGRPLWQRPVLAMAVVPVAILSLMLYWPAPWPGLPREASDYCVDLGAFSNVELTSCTGLYDGKGIAIVHEPDLCPDDAYIWVELPENGTAPRILCVRKESDSRYWEQLADRLKDEG